jgi:hypothetical protein
MRYMYLHQRVHNSPADAHSFAIPPIRGGDRGGSSSDAKEPFTIAEYRPSIATLPLAWTAEAIEPENMEMNRAAIQSPFRNIPISINPMSVQCPRSLTAQQQEPCQHSELSPAPGIDLYPLLSKVGETIVPPSAA